MKNMINSLFKLVKSGYQCKRTIKKHLKNDINSASYILATYYDGLIKEIEDKDTLTLDQIDTIVTQLNAHREEYPENDDVEQLLTQITSFFKTVKPFVKLNMA